MNPWSDYKSNDIVSLALAHDANRRFCYERAGLLKTLNQSIGTVWDEKNRAIGTVYRNPSGQYMNAAAAKLLAGPHQFCQLVNPSKKVRVGTSYEDATSETVFGLKRLG